MLKYKLSQELVDGHHSTVVDTKSQVLEIAEKWCDDFRVEEGATLEIEIVDMTDNQEKRLIKYNTENRDEYRKRVNDEKNRRNNV